MVEIFFLFPYNGCSIWPGDCVLDWWTDPPSYILHDNPRGLCGEYVPEPVWLAHQEPCPPPVVPCFDQPSSYHSPATGEAALLRIGETSFPHSPYTTTLSERHAVSTLPSSCSLSEYGGSSRLLVRPITCPSHHTSYPLDPGDTIRPDYFVCQWFESVRPCGAVVARTQSALMQHLNAAHAIHIKADNKHKVCSWVKCI